MRKLIYCYLILTLFLVVFLPLGAVFAQEGENGSSYSYWEQIKGFLVKIGDWTYYLLQTIFNFFQSWFDFSWQEYWEKLPDELSRESKQLIQDVGELGSFLWGKIRNR